MKDQTVKTLIFSALVSINIIVWYEILGIGFLIMLAIIVGVIALWKT